MSTNPFDHSEKFDFDLPAEGEEDNVIQLDSVREEAAKEKTGFDLLTASAAWSKLREWAKLQEEATLSKWLLSPITVETLHESNYERGVVHGIKLVIAMAEKLQSEASDTLQVFKESEKINDAG